MTKEEKQLLITDLCARLPYGVICEIYNATCTIKDKLAFGGISHFADDTICVRPYLRPMSSMTEEEEKEYNDLYYDAPQFKDGWRDAKYLEGLHIDWLNKNMFDYRGLIPMGLALEAPDGMYGKEENKCPELLEK